MMTTMDSRTKEMLKRKNQRMKMRLMLANSKRGGARTERRHHLDVVKERSKNKKMEAEDLMAKDVSWQEQLEEETALHDRRRNLRRFRARRMVIVIRKIANEGILDYGRGVAVFLSTHAFY